MKNTLILLSSLFFIILVSFSCNKKSKSTPVGDYLVIGHDGGFVAYVSPYYLITNNGLLEDTTHYSYGAVPSDFSRFSFNNRLPAARFDTVKGLLSSIPSELLKNNNADIGQVCPDYGYEDVRASINGVLYRWQFECQQSGSSAAVQDFVNKIRADF